MTLYPNTQESIRYAAGILRGGGLAAFPTETVYGLGADAANARAVAKIFTAKGRPANHPLIVHLAAADEIERWARDIPDSAWMLAEHFWPGPLTLILKRAPGVLDAVTGGQNTIGLRVPDHPVALALLKAFGGGIAAPSANRFGRVSPTSAAHVIAEFGDAVNCVIDGGSCKVGLESTIIDLSGQRPHVLRPGPVMPDMLACILGESLRMPVSDSPRAPGCLASHYAPDTPLRLIDTTEIDVVTQSTLNLGHSVAILSIRPPATKQAGCRWMLMPVEPSEYGRGLYACLREVDTWGCHCILVELPSAKMTWEAVHDRLRRAAGNSQGQRDVSPAESASVLSDATLASRLQHGTADPTEEAQKGM
jgi:L-threonylcarbamoyladenylate synthase